MRHCRVLHAGVHLPGATARTPLRAESHPRYHAATVIEKVFAGFVVVACVLLALRLALSSRLRARVDAALRRGWRGLSWRAREAVRRPVVARRAKREAEDVIRRARRGAWDGNVFRPDAFDADARKQEPRSRKDLH